MIVQARPAVVGEAGLEAKPGAKAVLVEVFVIEGLVGPEERYSRSYTVVAFAAMYRPRAGQPAAEQYNHIVFAAMWLLFEPKAVGRFAQKSAAAGKFERLVAVG